MIKTRRNKKFSHDILWIREDNLCGKNWVLGSGKVAAKSSTLGPCYLPEYPHTRGYYIVYKAIRREFCGKSNPYPSLKRKRKPKGPLNAK